MGAKCGRYSPVPHRARHTTWSGGTGRQKLCAGGASGTFTCFVLERRHQPDGASPAIDELVIGAGAKRLGGTRWGEPCWAAPGEMGKITSDALHSRRRRRSIARGRPPTAALACLGSKDNRFRVSNSGHIAGMVNPTGIHQGVIPDRGQVDRRSGRCRASGMDSALEEG